MKEKYEYYVTLLKLFIDYGINPLVVSKEI